jgi:hypothetical protein
MTGQDGNLDHPHHFLGSFGSTWEYMGRPVLSSSGRSLGLWYTSTVKRIIIRESLKQPLVVIFEDLHWIDAETRLYPSQRFEC